VLSDGRNDGLVHGIAEHISCNHLTRVL